MHAGAEEIIVDQPREESISSLYDWIIAERAAREKKHDKIYIDKFQIRYMIYLSHK